MTALGAARGDPSAPGRDGGRDRRVLGLLAAGHACADLCQGAVPALVPFLVADRGLSFAQTGLLVLVMSVASSVVQPLVGLWADTRSVPGIAAAGVAIGGLGIAALGVAEPFGAMLAATAVAGLGIALFHPDGARRATVAAGERAAGGLSLFAVGGSAGFALAPILLTPAVLVAGLPGAAVVLAPALVVAALLARLPAVTAPVAGAGGDAGAPAEDRRGAFALLALVASLRAGAYFIPQAFLAAALVGSLGISNAAGNAALTALLVAGAAGTLVGGRLADRHGHRAVIVGGLAVTVPAVALTALAPTPPLAIAAAALLGFAVVSSYSATVVLGQELLPSRPSLAAGVTLGLAIGVGGLLVAALGPLADAAGPDAALWAAAGFAALGALLARALPR